ncbi:MAG: alkaline phosphatase [Chromatocurvus sp.]
MQQTLTAIASLSIVLAACAGTSNLPSPVKLAGNADVLPAHQRNSDWYRIGEEHIAARQMGGALPRAKNVILFVGDGMGISTVTAARILDGQRKGMSGEENSLSFEKFPFTGLAKTYNTDSQTADSAGTMSAMVTGVKTRIGVFGVDETAQRGDCASGKAAELVTALELAERAGKSTGIVSTTRITHATPAATYARTVDRDWENDSDLPPAAREEGCTDIARQLVNSTAAMQARFGNPGIDGIDVILGGGRANFLPVDAGRRSDGDNLVEHWLARNPDGIFVDSRESLRSAPQGARLLGLFTNSHMSYEQDRPESEPSLSDMTLAALDRLEDNREGYFLMVEGGRIDHAHHAGNASAALRDTIAFSEAVQAAVERTDSEDTLIIVTADHSHVFTIAGYPRRGNPILGKMVAVGETEPALAADGMPYTTVSYANGRGFRDLGDETNADRGYAGTPLSGRADLSDVDTTQSGYHQEALVPLSSETHGGEDVAVYASGPGAYLVSGTLEQNVLFHIMAASAGLIPATPSR